LLRQAYAFLAIDAAFIVNCGPQAKQSIAVEQVSITILTAEAQSTQRGNLHAGREKPVSPPYANAHIP
jgi:hypothetical protein